MKRHSDRDSTNHDRPWKNHRRPIRLVLEPLETRRLLAGLNVSVLIDQDGSRSADAADTAASRRVVFLDLNNNGRQDTTDPVAFTNEQGVANFEGVAAGDYAVGLAAGNSLQSQAFPYRVEELATNVGPAAKTLIASDNLSKVWAFDGDGLGQMVSSPTSTTKVRLGGAIVTSVSVGADAWLIVRSSSSPSGTKLVQFNLESGRQTISEIRGLNGRVVDRLVRAGSEVVAQLNGPGGIELATVSVVGGIPAIGVSAAFPSLVTFAGTANQLAVLEYQLDFSTTASTTWMQPSAKKLSVVDLSGFEVKASTVLPQAAKEISMSADGRMILAALSTNGVMVLNNDLELSPAAKLAEATSPLLTQSKDGRMVTGNANNPLEFIVWDVDSWQPSGRTRVPAATQGSMLTSSVVISNVVVADSGDRLVATGIFGTVASQLAQATTAPVTVTEDSTATAQLGVRVNGFNKAPSTTRVATASPEDTTGRGSLRAQVTDAENDTLWFNVLTSPTHGSLRVSPTGEWIYQPSENFNGTDRAIVRVFDGQDTSDVALVLNVTPVNDPPQGLRADIRTIPESGMANSADSLGYVTVFDVDQGSNYRFATPDQRFQIRNGKIYLAPNSKLDFETEPTIKLEIVATEDVVSGYQISTTATISIADINEPPTAVRILSDSLLENSGGATVGQLRVDDPDRVNHFDYVLSDSRFTVEDGILKLKPGVELDFEKANSISLSITVSDASGQSITQPVTLKVVDQNDAPTGIDVQALPIEEATPGAVIGAITVIDQDREAYQYTVSDARFEVVDGELKLKEGQSVNKTVDKNLELTITATSVNGGATIASNVDISVVTKKPIYQNPVDPRDVNGDGEITPLDALLLINYINSFGTGPIRGNGPKGGSGEGEVWIDVNGDGIISPLDILIIVNWLNRQRMAGGMNGAGEGSDSPAPVPLACPAVETRTNSNADHELENLLDQLTRERLARKA